MGEMEQQEATNMTDKRKNTVGETTRLDIYAAVTDVGLRKKTNQDSHFVRVAYTPIGKSMFAIVCDGVGGLSHGEMASALVTETFARWYLDEYSLLETQPEPMDIARRWARIIYDCNARIYAYGNDVGAKIGTTTTAILVYGAYDFVALNIGDSRIYQIREGILSLTRDHTVANEAVANGELSVEDAAHDRRKNVLTRCVGTSQSVTPDYFKGKMLERDLVLLCSDGLYGKVSEMELHMLLAPFRGESDATMDAILKDIVEMGKSRGEKDNITAVLAKLT